MNIAVGAAAFANPSKKLLFIRNSVALAVAVATKKQSKTSRPVASALRDPQSRRPRATEKMSLKKSEYRFLSFEFFLVYLLLRQLLTDPYTPQEQLLEHMFSL